ncbi:M56 family metallopeptidase [Paenibacillus sp. MMO-58]|uniref:M56 family metallopeptidase n=1 Tax=Paenibacillus sp. MMO-58 TaxID=3081290 RepID=UPI00301813AC
MKQLKHHFILFLMALTSGFVWLQMMVYLLHELYGYKPNWGYLQYCVAALSEQSLLHQVVLLGLNIMIIYSFGMVLWIICKQFVLVRKWSLYVSSNRNKSLSNQLNSQYSQFKQRITVIDHDSILAHTFGFFRPRIVVSAKLIEQFSERQLAAILWHEWSHCRSYDPMRMLFVKIMNDSLPYIPIFKRLAHYIQVWVELQADQYSVRKMNSSYELASVLYTCSQLENRVPVGVGFADQAINYRIQQLIEPNGKIRIPLLIATPFLSSSLMVILLSSVLVSSCS